MSPPQGLNRTTNIQTLIIAQLVFYASLSGFCGALVSVFAKLAFDGPLLDNVMETYGEMVCFELFFDFSTFIW